LPAAEGTIGRQHTFLEAMPLHQIVQRSWLDTAAASRFIDVAVGFAELINGVSLFAGTNNSTSHVFPGARMPVTIEQYSQR
jgi:hypothetical protein